MAKDPILEIVESLSKGEKKGFSMLHRNTATKEKEWLKLYREMNNPRGFNSVKIIKKYKNEKAYYNARFILKRELDLFLINRESGPRKKLFNYTSLAYEYLDRQLFDHALDNIKKGKEIAEKYEALDELGVLLSLEKSIPEKSQSKSLRKEIESYYLKRDQFEQIGILSRRLEGGVREVRSEELKVSLVDGVLQDAKKVCEEGFLTDKAEFEWNVLFRKGLVQKRQYQAALLHSQKAILIFEEKIEELDQKLLEELINEYSILGTLHLYLGEQKEFNGITAKIRFFPIDFPGLTALKVSKLFLPTIAFHLSHGNFQQAKKEFEFFKPVLREKGSELSPKDLVRIYFYLSKLFFITEQPKLTIGFQNEFHAHKRQSPAIHQLYYPYSELMGIADLVQRELNEIANTRMKALKRFLGQQDQNYSYFRVLIKTLDHLIQYGSFFNKDFLSQNILGLHSLEEQEASQRHFSYFDPIPFLVSFLTKTSRKQAYKKKLKGNSNRKFALA